MADSHHHLPVKPAPQALSKETSWALQSSSAILSLHHLFRRIPKVVLHPPQGPRGSKRGSRSRCSVHPALRAAAPLQADQETLLRPAPRHSPGEERKGDRRRARTILLARAAPRRWSSYSLTLRTEPLSRLTRRLICLRISFQRSNARRCTCETHARMQKREKGSVCARQQQQDGGEGRIPRPAQNPAAAPAWRRICAQSSPGRRPTARGPRNGTSPRLGAASPKRGNERWQAGRHAEHHESREGEEEREREKNESRRRECMTVTRMHSGRASRERERERERERGREHQEGKEERTQIH